MKRVRFESLGSYTPRTQLSSDELIGRLSSPRSVDIAKITGIKNRRVYNSNPDGYESSFVLARNAIADCLDRSGYSPEDLDIVISASITRTTGPNVFSFEPSFALMLRNAIGATNARHFDVSNACAGMMTGTMVLQRMIRAGLVRNGLVVSGEHVTPVAETATREIAQTYDPQFASLTVGDAAVAVVMDDRGDEADAIHYVELMTAAEGAEYCIATSSEESNSLAMYTDNRAMMTGNGFTQGLQRMERFFEDTGRTWAGEGYDFWIHHQFSKPTIEHICTLASERFGAEMPKALNVLEDFGNTASTSHFLVLHEYLKRDAIPRGSKILMVSQASGRVWGFLSTTISGLQVN